MTAGLLRIATVVIGLAVLTLACSEEGPVSSGGIPASSTIPYLNIGGGADEQGFTACRTPDGGYLIVGLQGKPRSFFNDLYAVRTDETGAILGRYPVRRGDVHCNIWTPIPTADGGIVAVTTREGDTFLIKFASDGSIAWERDYGSYSGAGPAWYSLCTAGNGYLLTVMPDVWADLNTIEFFFTYADGTVRTTAQWPSTPRRIFSAAETQDGSFILAGAQWKTPSNLDIFVARTEPGSVTEDWSILTGTQNHDHAWLTVALDDDAVLFGMMDDPPEPPSAGYPFLMRLRSNGQKAWTRDISELGYVSGLTTMGDDLALAANNGTNGGAKIARLTGRGTVVWERTVGTGVDHESVLSIVADDEGFVVSGTTRPEISTDTDLLLASTDLDGSGYPFPPYEPECIDPVTPPDPSHVVGTQRSYSVVNNTGLGMEAIWALSSDFVIAVGDSGYITRFDGTSWSQMTSDTREELYDVYGFAEDDVFVAARHGKIFHYDGLSWSEMPSTATYLRSLWGAAPDDVWAGGVQLMHYDGSEWKDETPKGWWTPIDMDGITATDIYAVGAAGKVHQFDGCTWSTVYEAPGRLYGVTAIPGPLVYGVGDNGLFARYTGDTWESFYLDSSYDFTSAWARSENDVFIAGTSGFAGPYVLYWFNGSTWARQTQASTQALLDVTGTSDGNIFGATSYSYIVRGTP